MTAFTLDREAPAGVESVRLMGLDFAALSEHDTIAHVLDAVAQGRGGWVCPVNLDVLRQWRGCEDIRELVSHADLVVADGMPLIWAGGLQGTPLPERVAGSTLLVTMTVAASEAGASVSLLGGNPGTAEGAAERLRRTSPAARIAGTMCPPFGFEREPGWLDAIEDELRATGADIVFVGLGFPNQDRLIVELQERLPEIWFVSCGGSFSFVSGEIARGPLG